MDERGNPPGTCTPDTRPAQGRLVQGQPQTRKRAGLLRMVGNFLEAARTEGEMEQGRPILQELGHGQQREELVRRASLPQTSDPRRETGRSRCHPPSGSHRGCGLGIRQRAFRRHHFLPLPSAQLPHSQGDAQNRRQSDRDTPLLLRGRFRSQVHPGQAVQP